MDADLILVGGGLANGLIALRLAQLRPDLRVLVVEGGETFGGNHTWSFFDPDLTPEQHLWVRPLVAHRWPGYTVHFPRHERRLDTPYNSVPSGRLHAALCEALPEDRRLLGAPAVSVSRSRVQLADQRVLTARAVIDGRGQRAAPDLELGWQKFVGLEVELHEPHGLDVPVVMDARVDQLDGYRFVYVLPFGPKTCLIEDTYYTDGADLAAQDVEARVRAYAASRGWRIARVLRRERGVLPIAIGGDIGGHLGRGEAGVAPVGMAAALFHAITGYSFPNAVRTAEIVAALPAFDAATIDRALREHASATWGGQGYYRLLNKMLFRAARPGERWRVLDRFYTLDAALVGRFYAGRSTAFDKLRILAGKPPVPVSRAVAALLKG